MTENITDNFPLWLRIFYIVTGSIIIIFGFIAMIYVISESVLILLLGIALLLIIVNKLIVGNFDFKITREEKISNIVIGVVLFPFAIIALAGSTAISMSVLVVLLATAIILIGILQISRGYRNSQWKNWFRITIISLGYIIVGLAILSLGYDALLDKFKILILGVTIMIIGLTRLGDGLLGKNVMNQPKHEYI